MYSLQGIVRETAANPGAWTVEKFLSFHDMAVILVPGIGGSPHLHAAHTQHIAHIWSTFQSHLGVHACGVHVRIFMRLYANRVCCRLTLPPPLTGASPLGPPFVRLL